MANIHYKLSFPKPMSHQVKVQVKFSGGNQTEMLIVLPNWRPGRYELTNYVANLSQFKVLNQSSERLTFAKVGRNKWLIKEIQDQEVNIEYFYFANQLDAGGCLVDDQTIYLNFVNCLVYDPERMEEEVTISLDIPLNFDITCPLPNISNTSFGASDFATLVDSPFLASTDLKRLSYTLDNTSFEVVISGAVPIEDKVLIEAFQKFTHSQLLMMGKFPNDSFLFIIFSLPYRFYHGVEHKNSTVITLGPWSNENSNQYFEDLIGVSSHELFHAWNVSRIRPQELMPYDFSQENYYNTGFVTEGFTTYYGDLFLVRAGVFTHAQYFKELNKMLKRHYENYGRLTTSILDSSFDLWVDGYRNSAPHKKVSIYVKGCLIALMLDLTIRKNSGHTQSLNNILLDLWHSKKIARDGYTKEEVYELIHTYAGADAHDFISNFIEGCSSLDETLNLLLHEVGCDLVALEHPEPWASSFGIMLKDNVIVDIAPESEAFGALSIGDELLSLNGCAFSDIEGKELLRAKESASNIELTVVRRAENRSVSLSSSSEYYYSIYEIKPLEELSTEQEVNIQKWLSDEVNING